MISARSHIKISWVTKDALETSFHGTVCNSAVNITNFQLYMRIYVHHHDILRIAESFNSRKITKLLLHNAFFSRKINKPFRLEDASIKFDA